MKYALIFLFLPFLGKGQTIIITEDVIMKTHNHRIEEKDHYDCSVSPCKKLTLEEEVYKLDCQVKELKSQVKELSELLITLLKK